tara:strand:+ start:787 stop:1074 length:288 start_codon:yes stop_codon:yes gene_type:complete
MDNNMKYFKDKDNTIFAYELNGSQDYLIGDKVSITQAEVNSISAEAKAVLFNSLTYQELRAAAYPSIVDQLDLIYHGGIDAWKVAITAVKEEFPK